MLNWIRRIWTRSDDVAKDQSLVEQIQRSIAAEKALTPEILEQTKKLVEARRRNHFAESLTMSFASTSPRDV